MTTTSSRYERGRQAGRQHHVADRYGIWIGWSKALANKGGRKQEKKFPTWFFLMIYPFFFLALDGPV